MHPITSNRGKEPIILDDVDTQADDVLSSSSSLSLSLSLAKNAQESTKARSCKSTTHLLALSDVVSGASRKVRRERPVLPAGMIPSMPFVHPAFGTGPTLYMLSTTLIPKPDDMLSSPLGQHILDYEPLCGFVIPIVATFDGSTDPYNHMLHYNQAMTLNAGNDCLLCKVFPASFRGLALVWFHKLLRSSINSFNELWVAFVSQYLCSVRQKRNISSLQTILKKEEESI